ncbi:MAG TPA: SUMF1/EgtB/PvdO family nonheme iron enzyme, partial [Bryobacteraceae bacterium]|nr:SUMF1/EgtB/PvdO family nonheme iron enzyme [Bryobacteraceae bacterium]
MKALVSVAVAVCASHALAAPVDFTADVAPILESHCAACHSGERAAGGLAIVSRQALLDKRVLVPGKPEASTLYTLSTLPSNQRGAMPPGGPRLSDGQLQTLKSWIEGGANWPAEVALKTAPVAGASDEKATVQRIHARILAREKEAPPRAGEKYSVTIPNSTVKFDMVPVPAGEYLMGAAETDPAAATDEKPQRKVRVDPFWMQAHEVTWDEYRLFMFQTQTGRTPTKDSLVDAVAGPTRPYVEMSFGMGINGFPAISMTQHAANKYAQWLSAKTGQFYRLPTEAEWEYACRAGSPGPPAAAQLGDIAWHSGNSSGKYQPVGKKQPNAWGLYDILGNVMEWTLDQYAPYEAAAG